MRSLALVALAGGALACGAFTAAEPAAAGDAGASEAGVTDAGASKAPSADGCASFTCDGGLVCDGFDRPAPSGNGWLTFPTDADPKTLFIDRSDGCDGALGAFVATTQTNLAAQMLTRPLAGPYTSLTFDFDMSVDTKLEAFGSNASSVFLVLSSLTDLGSNPPYVAIGARKDQFSIFSLHMAGTQKEPVNFGFSPNKVAHFTWTYTPKTGATMLLRDQGTVASATIGTLTDSSLHLLVGVASDRGAADVRVRIDNLKVTTL